MFMPGPNEWKCLGRESHLLALCSWVINISFVKRAQFSFLSSGSAKERFPCVMHRLFPSLVHVTSKARGGKNRLFLLLLLLVFMTKRLEKPVLII